MRRLAFVLLLALGCDDPEVEAGVLDALVHGSVSAQVECVGHADGGYSGCGGLLNRYLYIGVTKIRDGAVLFGFGENADGPPAAVQPQVTKMFARSSGEASALEFVLTNDPISNGSFGTTSVNVGTGDVEVVFTDTGLSACGACSNTSPCTAFTLDIETQCTGFNLEAFGVE